MSTAPIAAYAAATSTSADPAAATIAADAAATNAEFESAALLGNPRRTRDLDRSMLDRPAPVSTMVGNPSRLRKLDAAAFTAV